MLKSLEMSKCHVEVTMGIIPLTGNSLPQTYTFYHFLPPILLLLILKPHFFPPGDPYMSTFLTTIIPQQQMSLMVHEAGKHFSV